MGKGDYHGASHIYASRAGTSPRAEYREFDFEPGREAEKDELDYRYDSMESSEDHWEAFQDGYAAALFTRLEIASSTLHLPSFVAMPDADSCGQNI